jgi:hypothetical protein
MSHIRQILKGVQTLRTPIELHADVNSMLVSGRVRSVLCYEYDAVELQADQIYRFERLPGDNDREVPCFDKLLEIVGAYPALAADGVHIPTRVM